MNAVSSLSFPAGRTLAGWWRLLAAQRPLALWVGYLFLHRIEALAAQQLSCPVDWLTQSLLQAIALENGAAPLLPHLQARLHLEPDLLRRLLANLVAEGLLAQPQEADWRLTSLGQQALQDGAFARVRRERRVFHFVEPLTPDADRPPHFVALTGTSAAQPWTAGDRLVVRRGWTCRPVPGSRPSGSSATVFRRRWSRWLARR